MSKKPKGQFGGACARTVCSRVATYYNQSTERFYCEDCAEAINRLTEDEAHRLYGSPLCVASDHQNFRRAGGDR